MAEIVSQKIIDETIDLLEMEMSAEDRLEYSKDLKKIFAMVNQLNTLDHELQDVKPMGHPLDFAQRLRDDKTDTVKKRQVLQKNAPEKSPVGGYYLVPQVIDHSDPEN